MDQDIPKICPSCGKKDITSFSTCRFCNTKYDAKARKDTVNVDLGLIAVVTFIIMVCGVLLYLYTSAKTFKEERTLSLTKSIAAVSRPRLIEIYTEWQGCPGGHQRCVTYNNIVQECQAEYGSKVDFQRINTDNRNPNDMDIVQRLSGGLATLPSIYLFNRRGEQVAHMSDDITHQALAKRLQDPDLYK